MQSNNKNNGWRIFGIVIVFLCLICLFVSGIYISIQPPSTVFNNSGYYIRLTKVYYLGGFPSTAFEVEGADVFTFEVLGETDEYAKDKNHVYLDGKVIPEADPATFELIDTDFARDKNHIYSGDSIYSDDPEHFEILDENLIRDSKHIYWSTKIISDDPANLEIIPSEGGFYTYFRDSTTVFINGGPIEDANVDTFEVIIDAYSRDDSNVFYFRSSLPADITTFEVLESPYSRDAQKVFWMENVITGADPQTFRVLNPKFQCSADSQTAFYQDQPIPNFDPNSIPSDAIVSNCDANGIYYH